MLGDLDLFLFLFMLSSSRSKICNVSQLNSFQLDRPGFAGKLEVCWQVMEPVVKQTFQEWKTICAVEGDDIFEYVNNAAQRVCQDGGYKGHQIVYFDNDPHLECLQCQQRIHNGNCQPRNRQYLFGILCMSPTVCQHTTVNTVMTVTTSQDSSCNQSASMMKNRSDSSDAAVIGILGSLVIILAIAVIGLSLVVIYCHKGNYRIKSRAHDPPIDNPVYGTSAITSVKTQNFADLAASHLKTESSGGEEEAGRDYHVLEGPLPEGSINSENYVIPGEEDSSVDSASVQSYEVPVNKHDNVGEEEEDEYREFFIPVKISKVQDCKFVLSTQD